MKRNFKLYHNLNRKTVNHPVLYLFHHRQEFFHKIIERNHSQYKSRVRFFFLTFFEIFFNKIISFKDIEDELPPDSAMSSAMSSATSVPYVIGNRFFGPDFSIEQLRGDYLMNFNFVFAETNHLFIFSR